MAPCNPKFLILCFEYLQPERKAMYIDAIFDRYYKAQGYLKSKSVEARAQVHHPVSGYNYDSEEELFIWNPEGYTIYRIVQINAPCNILEEFLEG